LAVQVIPRGEIHVITKIMRCDVYIVFLYCTSYIKAEATLFAAIDLVHYVTLLISPVRKDEQQKQRTKPTRCKLGLFIFLYMSPLDKPKYFNNI